MSRSNMRLYLAKPGGQKEGPFTLEQVQHDLATGKYRDSDFWAWHEGLPGWLPLYEVPGVHSRPVFTSPAPVPVAAAPKPEPKREPEPKPEPEPKTQLRTIEPAPTPAESRIRVELKRASEPEPRLEAKPEPEAKPKWNVQSEPDFKPELKHEFEPAPRSRPEPEPEPEPELELKQQPESELEPEPDLKNEPEPEPELEPGLKYEPEPQPESTPERRPALEPQPAPAPELDREPAPEPATFAARFFEAFEASTQTGSMDAETPSSDQEEPQTRPGAGPDSISSGLPFAALEQIFIFTTGQAREVYESPMVAGKLEEAVGREFEAIRGKVFVDVIGNVGAGFEGMAEGVITEKAWRAMATVRPFLTRSAREGAYQICIRPFSLESQVSVALLLLYDRDQCECPAV